MRDTVDEQHPFGGHGELLNTPQAVEAVREAIENTTCRHDGGCDWECEAIAAIRALEPYVDLERKSRVELVGLEFVEANLDAPPDVAAWRSSLGMFVLVVLAAVTAYLVGMALAGNHLL